MIRTFRVTGLFLRRLDELGVSPAAVFRQAGLPLEMLDEERMMMTTAQLFAFWRAVEEVSGDPAIGLELANEQRIERFDTIGVAALCARSFGDALARLARYKQLTCPEDVSVLTEGGTRVVRFGWPLANEPEPSVLLDVCFAWVVAIGRRGTGLPLAPLRIELADPRQRHDRYESWFGCPVRRETARNALVFAAPDLERPFVTHHPELLAMLAPQLEAELAQHLASRTTRDQVKAAVKRLLTGQRPVMRDVARELGMSPRTLQRRLTEEGVSFQQVLSDARRELARHYLRQPGLELNETAYLLGYNDPNSFFRAFHHWEGTSPGQWRALHLEAPALERVS